MESMTAVRCLTSREPGIVAVRDFSMIMWGETEAIMGEEDVAVKRVMC